MLRLTLWKKKKRGKIESGKLLNYFQETKKPLAMAHTHTTETCKGTYIHTGGKMENEAWSLKCSRGDPKDDAYLMPLCAVEYNSLGFHLSELMLLSDCWLNSASLFPNAKICFCELCAILWSGKNINYVLSLSLSSTTFSFFLFFLLHLTQNKWEQIFPLAKIGFDYQFVSNLLEKRSP